MSNPWETKFEGKFRQRSNATFIFLLLAAFMVFRWSPSHAHLNAQHDHGGEWHQHSVAAHVHQRVIFHADQVDVSHPQMDEDKVVDLDRDQCTHIDKKPDNPALSGFAYCPLFTQVRGIGLSKGCSSQPRLLHHQPGQPRAPPQVS